MGSLIALLLSLPQVGQIAGPLKDSVNYIPQETGELLRVLHVLAQNQAGSQLLEEAIDKSIEAISKVVDER